MHLDAPSVALLVCASSPLCTPGRRCKALRKRRLLASRWGGGLLLNSEEASEGGARPEHSSDVKVIKPHQQQYYMKFDQSVQMTPLSMKEHSKREAFISIFKLFWPTRLTKNDPVYKAFHSWPGKKLQGYVKISAGMQVYLQSTNLQLTRSLGTSTLCFLNLLLCYAPMPS